MNAQATLARDVDLRAEVEQLRRANKGLAIDLANTQTLLLAESRKVNSLEKQLEKARGQNITQQDALRVFDLWCQRMGKRKGTKFGEKRQAKVKARMREGFTADDLCKAVEGCHAAPYQLFAQHIAKPVRGAVRRDDLDYICQDESQVERFMEIAELGPEDQRGTNVVQLPRRPRVDKRTAQEFVDDLELRAMPLDVVHLGNGRFKAQCPAHPDKTPSLSIKECDDGTILLHCFAGCTTQQVVESIGWQMPMLRGRS